MVDINANEISEDEICECGHLLSEHSAPLKIGDYFYRHYYGCAVEFCECADLLENKPEAVPYRKDYRRRPV